MSLTQPALKGDIINSRNRDIVERIVIRRRGWLARTLSSLKALSSVPFMRSSPWTYGGINTTSSGGTYDYRERAGDGRNNAIVFSALELLANTFAQSPITVKQIVGDQENIVPNHEMVRRITKPNDYYSGLLLWKATIIDYAFGNAYWLKVRSGAGKPVQFYWIPSYMIEPKWPSDDPNVFISHYEYNPNGQPISIAVDDVVHFRNGLDPRNIRKGLSPLGALLREIATDEEAAEFTNTILRNLGVAGMVISPASDKGKISDPEAHKIKVQVMQRTQGDRRGEPLVIGGAVKVDQMSVDTAKLDLAGLRHLPEERITAIFGTPAVLLGLGTGLENATFSNVDGLRRIFYENKVIPLQEFIAADIHTQLFDDYEAAPDNFLIQFDNEDVRVLKEDEDKSVDRIIKEVETGLLTRDEARALRGREAGPTPDVYLISSRIIPVAVDKLLEKSENESAAAQAAVEAARSNTSSDDANDASGGNSGGSAAGGGTSGKGHSKRDTQHVHTKDVAESITRIRTRMRASAAADVHGYLVAQRDDVIAQVQEQSKADARAKIRINWPRVQEDYDALKGVLEPWYKRVLVAVHDVVQDVLDTRYELGSTDERTYLKTAALNIKGINEYTRQSVATAIAESGDDVDALVARLMDLHVFSEERANLIAITEISAATNLAQIESYRASDVVVGVHITDGDKDKVCANLNGTKVRISEARSIPPLGHPSCVRRFHHITDASEFAGAA